MLGHIEERARAIGFERGVVCDLFAGTGVVGRYFRARGNRVLSTDLMECSYVFQKVFLELEELPHFAGLAAEMELPEPQSVERLGLDPLFAGVEGEGLLRVIRHLEERIAPADGILTRQYSPAGAAGRRYLHPRQARRLDAMLLEIGRWERNGWIAEAERYLLLALVIDAADRVANISGTYGAYLKSWQSNALDAPVLRVPEIPRGPCGRAHRRDALEWIAEVRADLLYIDPPYNNRQYPANYHLLEVIAQIPTARDPAALEESIYGKTGLIPWRHRASPFCVRRGSRCRDAFREILTRTTIPRVLISYNEEGIVTRQELEELLAEYAGVPRSRLGDVLEKIPYPRFRSDADGRISRSGSERRYRRLPERRRDEVCEWLFSVARRRGRTGVR